ncbi:hypothetical protein ACFLWW_03950 [Chloroflexota bacterium]
MISINILEKRKCGIAKEIYQYILEGAYQVEMPAPYVYHVWKPWVNHYSGEYSIGRMNSDNNGVYVWIDADMKREMLGK